VIEVKGGQWEREGQTWYMIDGGGNRRIVYPGPIAKSIDNVQYILRNQRRILGTDLRIAMPSVVWFSDAEVRMQGAEGARVLPAAAIHGNIAADMLRYLDQTRERMHIADREPMPNTVNLIRQTICPDIHPAPHGFEQENAEELNKLTEEQIIAYQATVDRNHRVLVEGAAGTGKTYVGLAVARAHCAGTKGGFSVLQPALR